MPTVERITKDSILVCVRFIIVTDSETIYLVITA